MKHILIVLLLLSAGLGLRAAQEARPPLSKDEVLDLLSSSTPSKVIVSTIQQCGIAFKPTDAVLGEFRKAGADTAVLAALRQAWRAEIPKPLSDMEIRTLLAADAPSENIARLVLERGIDFHPTADYLKEIRSQGAKDELIEMLRVAVPRPFSREELLQLLGTHMDQNWIAQKVQQRAIDFEPGTNNLQALRKAGAQAPLLEAVRTAKRGKPFVPQSPPPPQVSNPLEPSQRASLFCDPSDKDVPVLRDPNDLGSVVAHLHCGVEVTFLGKVDFPPGFAKIRYADGKEGFISNFYLALPIATPGGDVMAPSVVYRPNPAYTPEARDRGIEGVVALWIVIDAQGNVSDIKQVSEPLGGGLDKSAFNTVKTWKFTPATRNGVPVPVRVIVEVTFRLHQDSQ